MWEAAGEFSPDMAGTAVSHIADAQAELFHIISPVIMQQSECLQVYFDI